MIPVQFGILGPLEVRAAGGEPVAVGGPRSRALLVLLALDADRVVGVEQLIAGQYGDDPPADATNAVQSQVSRLRKTVAGIEFLGGGYRLAADPDDVDALRFERLAREGRHRLAAGDHAGARDVLREALGLWRGRALADLPHGQAMATRLEDVRLDATEDLVEAELALPEGTSVAELRRLAGQHPLRERLRGQLMRALHAAGRQAEALTEFEDIRRLLADDLGADPSAGLAAVHLAILRAVPGTTPARPGRTADQLRRPHRGAGPARRAAGRAAGHDRRAGWHRQDPPRRRVGRARGLLRRPVPGRGPGPAAAGRARRARAARGRAGLARHRPDPPPGGRAGRGAAGAHPRQLRARRRRCRRARPHAARRVPGAHDRRHQPGAARAHR